MQQYSTDLILSFDAYASKPLFTKSVEEPQPTPTAPNYQGMDNVTGAFRRLHYRPIKLLATVRHVTKVPGGGKVFTQFRTRGADLSLCMIALLISP